MKFQIFLVAVLVASVCAVKPLREQVSEEQFAGILQNFLNSPDGKPVAECLSQQVPVINGQASAQYLSAVKECFNRVVVEVPVAREAKQFFSPLFRPQPPPPPPPQFGGPLGQFFNQGGPFGQFPGFFGQGFLPPFGRPGQSPPPPPGQGPPPPPPGQGPPPPAGQNPPPPPPPGQGPPPPAGQNPPPPPAGQNPPPPPAGQNPPPPPASRQGLFAQLVQRPPLGQVLNQLNQYNPFHGTLSSIFGPSGKPGQNPPLQPPPGQGPAPTGQNPPPPPATQAPAPSPAGQNPPAQPPPAGQDPAQEQEGL